MKTYNFTLRYSGIMFLLFCNIGQIWAFFYKDGIRYEVINQKEDTIFISVGKNPGTPGDITIPSGWSENQKVYIVKRIDALAFYQSYTLTSINIPNTVDYIGESAFLNCRDLKSVNLSNQIKYICDETFSGCSSLTSINIPDGCTGIGSYAFNHCGIESISLPKNLETIEYGAFNACPLKAISLPNSLKGIGGAAFSGCI